MRDCLSGVTARHSAGLTVREGPGRTLCEPLDLTLLNPLFNLSLVKIAFYHP